MKRLFAFYENEKVGTLTKSKDDVYAFEYEETWLDHTEAFAISFSLPLEKKKFGNRDSLSFFENLLPEGEVLREIQELYHVHGTFDFLEKFGQDCAGAIMLSPNESKDRSLRDTAPRKIDIDEIYKVIDEKSSIAEVIVRESPGYLSLAGAQDKFPCVYKDGAMFIPTNGSPTTHIVKMPIWRHGVSESVFNEYLIMELAHRLKLTVPEHFIHEGPHPLYVIERFDRFKDESGQIKRLHQQDFCQAQGFPSTEKYEVNGGPTFANNYKFLLEHTSASYRVPSLNRLLAWLAFNLLIGNNDSHSKNISILMKSKHEYQLAPFYDLLSTVVYPRLKTTFSYKIGDRHEFSKIGKNQIEQLEDALAVKRGTFKEILQETAEKIQNLWPVIIKECSDKWPHVKVFKKIEDSVKKRYKSLIMQNAIK